MLTQRIQLLLDQRTVDTLKILSKRQKVSVNEIIRQAIANTYAPVVSNDLHEKVLNFQKKIKGLSKKEILEFRHHGHRI